HDLGHLQGFVAGANVAWELSSDGSALFENNRFDQIGGQEGLAVIASSNVVIRNNQFNGGYGVTFHADDHRAGISNVQVYGNTFDHSTVLAYGGSYTLSGVGISIDNDKFVTGTSPLFWGLSIWGNTKYTTLSSVYSALGFEQHGMMVP